MELIIKIYFKYLSHKQSIDPFYWLSLFELTGITYTIIERDMSGRMSACDSFDIVNATCVEYYLDNNIV